MKIVSHKQTFTKQTEKRTFAFFELLTEPKIRKRISGYILMFWMSCLLSFILSAILSTVYSPSCLGHRVKVGWVCAGVGTVNRASAPSSGPNWSQITNLGSKHKRLLSSPSPNPSPKRPSSIHKSKAIPKPKGQLGLGLTIKSYGPPPPPHL